MGAVTTTSPLVCIVTGANKGIGLAVTRALCSLPGDRLVYLTSRDRVRGEGALKSLQEEGLQPRYHQLDITDDNSVKGLHDYMKDSHGGIDVLVNNAGIAYTNDSKAPFAEQATVTVETNFGGTRRVCRQLFPLLRRGARVVNVTSNCGHLSKIGGEEPAAGVLRHRLASKELTERELVEMMQDFVQLAKEGEHVKNGWPNSAYKVSKVGVSALTIIQQMELDRERAGEDLVINHAHPGYVDTDMTSHKGQRTVEEGAKSLVFAATLPSNTDIKGEYIWENSSVTSWVEEKVNLFY
eukprot:GFUD01075928.1.p1 GENE.GFUD01075928.1~~GFUD01075928.1.p1  ORF type:complete len:296 (+),score=89.31 GFUD01075928.1:63-950(+)